MDTIDIYLEIGSKRAFAGALDWPGWCRSGRDAEGAVAALLAAGPRYSRVLALEGMRLSPPDGASALVVVERLEGSASTDFGAPDAVPGADNRPFDAAGLQRSQAILRACWQAFDLAMQAAWGKALRKGPRGGGRDLDGILAHVLGAEQGYLSRLAWKLPGGKAAGSAQAMAAELQRTRQAVLEALENAAGGGLPEKGPRGGKIWLPRYFVRRSAWHVLDHAWELEDRIE